MIDLKDFVGKNVHVEIWRKKRVRKYDGRLTDICRTFICLEVDNRDKWIPRPRHCDVVKCLD